MQVKPGSAELSAGSLPTLRFFLAVHASLALSKTADNRFFDFSQERL